MQAFQNWDYSKVLYIYFRCPGSWVHKFHIFWRLAPQESILGLMPAMQRLMMEDDAAESMGIIMLNIKELKY